MEKIEEALARARQLRQQQSLVVTGRREVEPLTLSSDSKLVLGPDAMRSATIDLDLDHLEKNRIVAHTRDHAKRAPFDYLRIKLHQIMSANDWRTVGIVSPSSGVGKTVLSINLAISIARLQETSSLLVDMDFRSPSVLSYLGVEPELSLADYLEGDCNFEETLVYPQIKSFVATGTIRPIPNSAEILASNRTDAFINQLRRRYVDRIVMFDLPPLLAGDDAIAVLPKLDCALLVVAEGVTTQSEIKDCMRDLPEGVNLLGTIFNQASHGMNSVDNG